MKRPESETEVARMVCELVQSDTALAERVARVGRGMKEPALVVGLSHGGITRCVARGTGERYSVGCVTKLFTGALVMQAVTGGRLNLQSEISDLLGDSGAEASLSGITVQHLLEHTHGLDGIDTPRIQIRDDGFIDVPALCHRVTAHPPIAPPGSLHSYGIHGAVLLAAILEHELGAPYGLLLRRELFDRLGVCSDREDPDSPSSGTTVHPSLGGTLRLTAPDMLRFLRHAMTDSPGALFHRQNLPHIRKAVTPLPGWNSNECGIHLGWKDYGAGWFGHNSIARNEPSLVRIHPERDIALVIASTGYSPPAAALELFGDFMPSLAAGTVPAVNGASDSAPRPEQFCGTYSNANCDVRIVPAGHAMEMHALHRLENQLAQPFHRASLRRAANNLHFVMPPEPTHFPFLQFIHPTAHGFEYLWNGQRLWRVHTAPRAP